MKKGLAYALYLIFLLVLIEVVLRFCFPIPELRNFNRINYQILDQTQGQSSFIRNIHMQWNSSVDTNASFTHELNGYGYRDPKEWKQEKEAGKKRFFFLGDSFVEGMMSTSDATITVGFEKASAQQDFEWFNCGMMGIGLNEYMKFIVDAVPIFKPDEVFLVLYSNDLPFQREYWPEAPIYPVQNTLDWRLKTLFNRIKADDPIPFAFSPEKRPFYKAVPDPGNPWTYQEQELKQHVTPRIAAAMKAGTFNFFRSNWILEEEKFLKSPIDLKNKFAFMRDYLERHQCKLNIFYVPSRSQVSAYYFQFERQACLQKCPDFIDLTGDAYQVHAKTITQYCQELGIPFHDFSPEIRSLENSGKHMYWNYDDHMRGGSYLYLGKRIHEIWSAEN